MNMNNMISYLLIIILLSILCPRFTQNSLFFLISLIIIGYNITKNISMSIGVALFITYVLVLLNNKTGSITENFKSKSKKRKKAQIKKPLHNEEEEGINEEDSDFKTETLITIPVYGHTLTSDETVVVAVLQMRNKMDLYKHTIQFSEDDLNVLQLFSENVGQILQIH